MGDIVRLCNDPHCTLPARIVCVCSIKFESVSGPVGTRDPLCWYHALHSDEYLDRSFSDMWGQVVSVDFELLIDD